MEARCTHFLSLVDKMISAFNFVIQMKKLSFNLIEQFWLFHFSLVYFLELKANKMIKIQNQRIFHKIVMKTIPWKVKTN